MDQPLYSLSRIAQVSTSKAAEELKPLPEDTLGRNHRVKATNFVAKLLHALGYAADQSSGGAFFGRLRGELGKIQHQGG